MKKFWQSTFSQAALEDRLEDFDVLPRFPDGKRGRDDDPHAPIQITNKDSGVFLEVSLLPRRETVAAEHLRDGLAVAGQQRSRHNLVLRPLALFLGGILAALEVAVRIVGTSVRDLGKPGVERLRDRSAAHVPALGVESAERHCL